MKHSIRWITPAFLMTALLAVALGWWLRGLVLKPGTPPDPQAVMPDQNDGRDAQPKNEHTAKKLPQSTVTILAEAPGLAPEEVEALVVFPIESQVNGMSEVERTRSVSRAGSCVIWVDFEPKTEIFQARQRLHERLQLVQQNLPPNVMPMLAPISFSESEVLLIALRLAVEPKTLEERTARGMDLRTLADHVLRPRLLAVPGVAQVVVSGGIRKQYQVVLDPRALLDHGVTLQQVEETLKKSTLDAGGFLTGADRERPLLIRGPALSLKDLGATPVVLRQQRPVLLENIAAVRFGGPDRLGDGAVWLKEGARSAGGLAVILTVLKQRHAKVREIDQLLDQVQQELPPGVRLERQTFTRDDLNVSIQLIPGTSREARDRLLRHLEGALLEVPEVNCIWRRVMDDDAVGADSLELFIALQKNANRPREQILTDVRARMAKMPGVRVRLGEPVLGRIDCVAMTAAIAVKGFGPDLDVLRQTALDIQARMSKVPGVVDLLVEPPEETEQLQLRVKRQEAARHGLAVADLAAVLEMALKGRVIGEVLEGVRRFHLVVMYDEKLRGDPQKIGKLLVEAPAGGRVSVDQVVEILHATGPVAIYREDAQRRMVISCNVQGRERAAVLKDVRRALEPVEENLRNLPGYRIEAAR